MLTTLPNYALFLCALASILRIIQSQATPSLDTVDSLIDIQFNIFNFTATPPQHSTMQITFPTQFDANELHNNAPYSGYDAAAGDSCPDDFSCTGVSVSYVGGYTFQISGLFPIGGALYMSYSILGIRSPQTAGTTSDFQVRILDPSNTLVYDKPEAGVTFTAKDMTCSGSIVQGKMVGSISTIKLSLSPTIQPDFDPISSLTITIPSQWENQQVTASTLTTQVFCSSLTHPFITCKKQTPGLKVSNINFSPTIQFNLQSVYGPSSVMDTGKIQIKTVSKSNAEVQKCEFYISGFSERFIADITMNIDYASDTIISLEYTFIVYSSTADTKLLIVLPPQIELQTQVFKVVVINTQVIPTPATYFLANKTLVIDPFTFYSPSIQVTVTFLSVVRPRIASSISQTQILAYENTNLKASSLCCTKFLIPRETLAVTTPLTLDDPSLLSSPVQYTIIFNKNAALSYLTTDQIHVTFPQKYQITNGVLTCSLSSDNANVNSAPTCSVTNNLIKITSFLQADFSSAAQLTLKIEGITNPAVNPSSDPFIVSICSQNGQIIERNSNAYATLEQAIIPSFVITSNSYLVFDSGVEIEFSFSTSGIAQKGYFFVVTFPVQMTIRKSLLSCVVNSNSCPCWIINSQQIKIEVPTDQVSTSISLKVDGFTNPTSQQPTDKFQISVYDTKFNKIEKSDPNFSGTMTMTSVPVFPLCKATLKNSNQAYLQSTLNLIAVLPFLSTTSLNILTITYPSTDLIIDVGGTSSCTGCSFVGNTIIVTISDGVSMVELDVSNIAVAKSVSDGAVLLDVKLQKTGGYLSVESTGIEVGDVMPTQISYSLSQSSWVLSDPTQITINYNINIDVSPSLNYILIYIPSEYSAPTLTNNRYNYSILTGTIVIPDTLVSNPSLQKSSYFILAAFTSTDSLIAISRINSQFALICDLPCKTCNGVSNCTSCYTTLAEDKFFDDNGDGYCVSSCPQKYYLDTTVDPECLPCDSNCQTCSETSPTICLSCLTNQYLHDVDDKCYGTCPDGFFSDVEWCTACPGICTKCTNQTYCTQCQGALYLYDNLCITSCPPSTYELNSPNLCIDCTMANCLFCSSTSCISCVSTHYLYNGLCYAQCPSNLLPNQYGTCSVCQCQTCQSFSYFCLTCKAIQPYFYANKCYNQCPSGTCPDANDNCLVCPANCVTCDTTDYCTLCKQNYALMIESITIAVCLDTCPQTHIQTLSNTGFASCQTCQFPCLTCSISISFCVTCVDNYFFHNNTCVSVCPSPLYQFSGNCQLCIPECQNCTSDPYECTQCNTGYYLYGSNCHLLCPAKTYTDQNSKSCIDCGGLCSTCQTSIRCTACITGYFLLNGACQVECPTIPIIYYTYEGHCQLCQPQCKTCLDTPIACTQCISDQYLQNSVTFQCTFSCSFPYFQKNLNCVPCQSPCYTCDSSYDICQTCISGYYLYAGSCIQKCLQNYYQTFKKIESIKTGYCQECDFPCLTCIENQCILCQDSAFLYKNTCVLVCPNDMPYEENGYCSECVGVQFCGVCGFNNAGIQICTQCVYPYVLFQQGCLGQCPENYTINDNKTRQCVITAQYQKYLDELAAINAPLLPPMFFLILYLVLILAFFFISRYLYKYTYHIGYFIALLILLDACCLYYTGVQILQKYLGQYGVYNGLFMFPSSSEVLFILLSKLPAFLIGLSILINHIILVFIFNIVVISKVYYTDVRYNQYFMKYRPYWWIFILFLMPAFGGHRLHKLNYSKLFGLRIFSYRIVSVSKFKRQDYLTFVSSIGDLFAISAAVFLLLNVDLTHHTLIYSSYEIIFFKIILWTLLFWDLKKPDRGFFMGDQQQAALQIEEEEEQEKEKLQRVDTENFIKLIRTKSVGHFEQQKLYNDLQIEDFKSVYNPEEYEDVKKVPKKKIQKNIYRGTFRKGKKITIEEKLNRFADSIKPAPKKAQDIYLKQWLYFKAPKIKVVPKKKQSDESMLQLLNRKENEYKYEIQEAQEKERNRKNSDYYYRNRYSIEQKEETIPNETVDFFYPEHSIETNPMREQSIDYDDLMNLNYARKKHLSKNIYKEQREESMRVLRHSPKKKRKNLLRGYQDQTLKKYERQFD